VAKPRPPQHLDRRIIERRNRFHRLAQQLDPKDVEGTNAKWEWLHAIVTTNLPSTSRLVAHTLCLHGRSNGEDIYPSVRTLSAESGLTQTAVCKHLEVLAVNAFLQPFFMAGRGGRSHARTVYRLTLPAAVQAQLAAKPWVDDPEWKPEEGTQRRGVPNEKQTEGTQRGEEGTQPRCEGTQRHAVKALNVVEPSLSLLVSQGVTHTSVPVGTASVSDLKTSDEESTRKLEFAEQRRREREEIKARSHA
jgi:hypothetical protein